MVSDNVSETIGVLGAGAMGSLFGARLAAAGADPLLVDVDEKVVARICERGVTLRRGQDEQRIAVRATTDPRGEAPVDVLVIFVKSYATESALRLASPLISDRTSVLSLQNGWGNADRISAVVPTERVFVGVTYHSATLVEPGVVDHTATGRTYLGPIAGGSLGAARSIGDALQQGGFEVEVTSEVGELLWRKLVLNAAANPVAALTGLRAKALTEVPEVFALIQGIAREVIAVGLANGYAIDTDRALADVRDVLVNAGSAKSSMRQDVEAGRRTEFDVMTGAVLRNAEQLGVETPLSRAIHALIAGYEASRASV